MAAGMWQGLLAGYQSVEEKRAAREEKEAEVRERRKQLALELASRYGTRGFAGAEGGGGSESTGTTAAAAPSQGIEHYSQVLKTQFNVSDEAISRVAGVAGATGLNQAFEVLERTRNRFAELGQEMPEDIVNNLFDSAVLTGSQTDPIDFDVLEDYIGGALDPLERELLTASRRTAGQVYFPEPSVMPPPSLEDVGRLETKAIQDITQNATIEIRNLNEALNNIRQTEESETDPTRLEELKDLKEWVTARQLEVRDALSSAEGEGGNPFKLVTLYGNQFFTEMFENDPRLSTAILAPVFRETRNATPKRVESMAQLEELASLGLIKVGDRVEVFNETTQEYVLNIITGE